MWKAAVVLVLALPLQAAEKTSEQAAENFIKSLAQTLKEQKATPGDNGKLITSGDNYEAHWWIGAQEDAPNRILQLGVLLTQKRTMIRFEDLKEFKNAWNQCMAQIFTDAGLQTGEQAIESAYEAEDNRKTGVKTGFSKRNGTFKCQAYLTISRKDKVPVALWDIEWAEPDNEIAKAFKAKVAAIAKEESEKAQARAKDRLAEIEANEKAAADRKAKAQADVQAEEDVKKKAAAEKAAKVAAAPIYHLANGTKIRAMKVQEVKAAGIIRIWDEDGEQHSVIATDVVQIENGVSQK